MNERAYKSLLRHTRKLEKKLKRYKGGGNMDALKEALREGLRVVVLAIVPMAILELQNGVVDIKAISVVGLIALLKFVDSLLHETGTAEKGLTRF